MLVQAILVDRFAVENSAPQERIVPWTGQGQCSHDDEPLEAVACDARSMLKPDAAALAREFPPQSFVLDLRKVRGFVAPPGVSKLVGDVTLNLALGAHYFFTAVQGREPTFGLVQDFLSFSTQRDGRHVFTGSSLGGDAESNASYSNLFAKIVGVAFMSEHADATWFAPLLRLWGTGLSTPAGTIDLRKRHPKKDGPDFLCAPFDPSASASLDPLYVLEFKGRTGALTFDHGAFKSWRSQARNIQAKSPTGAVNLKSWILAFNYAFEHGTGREQSALLVEDPWTETERAEPLEPARASIETVVREHIARQCSKLGAPLLAPAVLAGRRVENGSMLPAIFRVRHPRLSNRRYIGGFATWGLDGELCWTTGPRHPWASDYELFVDAVGAPFHAHVRVRGRGSSPTSRVVAEVFAGGPMSRADLERLVRSVVSGGGGDLFVGQDAAMIRACVRARRGQPLDDEAFTTMLDVRGEGSAEGEAVGFVQLLRNGSVIADAQLVETEKAPDAWWQGR